MNDTDRIKRLRLQTEEFAQELGRRWTREKADRRRELEALRTEVAELRGEVAQMRVERSLRIVA